MKRSWAMKWARDLETTKAKQARGTLNDRAGGFCCLGRACVVGGLRFNKKGYGAYYANTLLPDEIVEKFGFRNFNPEIDGIGKLSNLNDEGMTFPEIAKLIRKHWKSL